MHIVFYCVWIPGIILQALLLFRGWRSANIRNFPFFYSYIAAGTAAAIIGFAVLNMDVSLYRRSYWVVQFCTLIAGCGLILETFDHVLSPYPGAKNFARRLCLVSFAMILASGVAYSRLINPGQLSVSEIQLERDVRCAQIILFAGILAVMFYYELSLNRNTQGMIQGYGLYLATSLVSLALRSYFGSGFDEIWNTLQPLAFDLSLLIWLFAFWAYSPGPAVVSTTNLESDYDALVATTRQAVNSMRAYVGRAIRP